jgi:AAA+ superfamily predicted ATPase
MVTHKVRSFFLNELDGLAANTGILTIATTNHPERIDDAIINRPSRFDVKYTFAVPARPLRVAFARKWVDKVERGKVGRGIKFTMEHQAIAERVGENTEGFSFAFLKELCVAIPIGQRSLTQRFQLCFLPACTCARALDESRRRTVGRDPI